MEHRGTVARMTDWTSQTWLVAGARNRTPGEPLNVAPVFASNSVLGSANSSRGAGAGIARAARRASARDATDADAIGATRSID